jgi:hypothetical protein
MKCKLALFVCLLLSVFCKYKSNAQTQNFQLPPDTASQKQLSNNNDSILKWKQSRDNNRGNLNGSMNPDYEHGLPAKALGKK